MNYKEIMNMPYIQFVISMLDSPSIDYDSKNKKGNIYKPETAEEQLLALKNAF